MHVASVLKEEELEERRTRVAFLRERMVPQETAVAQTSAREGETEQKLLGALQSLKDFGGQRKEPLKVCSPISPCARIHSFLLIQCLSSCSLNIFLLNPFIVASFIWLFSFILYQFGVLRARATLFSVSY